jgi:hypothetical protein
MTNEKRGLTTIDEKAFEKYKKLMEKQTEEQYKEKEEDDDTSSLELEKEALQSLLQFQDKLAQDDFVNASASLADFTTNVKGLADGLTGENAEEIKSAVNQFGQFSENAMNVIAAFNQAGSPMSAPGIEGEVVPASFTFTEDQAKLIAQQIMTQLQVDGETGDVAEKTGETVTNDDLGVEIRDSKRSILSEIDSVKSSLDALVKEIEKKAMTFKDIYKKLCVTIVRDHKRMTGRNIG